MIYCVLIVMQAFLELFEEYGWNMGSHIILDGVKGKIWACPILKRDPNMGSLILAKTSVEPCRASWWHDTLFSDTQGPFTPRKSEPPKQPPHLVQALSNLPHSCARVVWPWAPAAAHAHALPSGLLLQQGPFQSVVLDDINSGAKDP